MRKEPAQIGVTEAWTAQFSTGYSKGRRDPRTDRLMKRRVSLYLQTRCISRGIPRAILRPDQTNGRSMDKCESSRSAHEIYLL